MLTLERRNKMLEFLEEHKSARISHLSKTFFIGEATIRRDLEKLEKQGLVRRTYGGAILIQDINSEIPLAVREKEQFASKDAIAKHASTLVTDGDIIILDSSTTANMIVNYLKPLKNLTVITNGLKVSSQLGEHTSAKVYCTGGKLRENSLSFTGVVARKCIETMYARTLFFSCRGISAKHGATDYSVEEADLRRAMIQSADTSVLICDDTKFNQSAFFHVCNFNELDYFITNTAPPKDILESLKKSNVKIIY